MFRNPERGGLNSFWVVVPVLLAFFFASRHPQEGPEDESEADVVRRWAMLTSNDNFFSF
jgi:hypothetical protein